MCIKRERFFIPCDIFCDVVYVVCFMAVCVLDWCVCCLNEKQCVFTPAIESTLEEMENSAELFTVQSSGSDAELCSVCSHTCWTLQTYKLKELHLQLHETLLTNIMWPSAKINNGGVVSFNLIQLKYCKILINIKKIVILEPNTDHIFGAGVTGLVKNDHCYSCSVFLPCFFVFIHMYILLAELSL